MVFSGARRERGVASSRAPHRVPGIAEDPWPPFDPHPDHALGLIGLAAAVPLGVRFVAMAWRLRRDTALAMPTFRYSIVYLFGLFAALLAEEAGPDGVPVYTVRRRR